MRITYVVAVVALLSSSALAQESVQIDAELNTQAPVVVVDGEASTETVLDGEVTNTIAPVLYQEGIVVEGVGGSGSRNAVEGAMQGAIQGEMVTEPSSVMSGEVIQSAPLYTEGVPIAGGTVIGEGAYTGEGTVITDGGMMNSAPAMSTPSCGCGTASAAPAMTYSGSPAPAMTYSSSPAPAMNYSSLSIQYSAPVSTPCCNQPRRGFFRSWFGN